MSEYDELISEHRSRCMCAPNCAVPEECDMCSKVKCIHCMSADALDGLVKERDRDSHIIAREFRRAVKAEKRCAELEAEASSLAKSSLRQQDELNAQQSKLIDMRNTIVGLRNVLEFVDYHINRDNTEAKEAIRIALGADVKAAGSTTRKGAGDGEKRTAAIPEPATPAAAPSDEVKKMAALLRQDAMVFGPHTYKSSFMWHAADCLEALEAGVEELRAALKPFAKIKADDGDTFDTWNDDVIIRCEVTVGDLKKARAALEAKP